MRSDEFVIGDRPLDYPADGHPDWSAAYGVMRRYTVLGASAVGQQHLRRSSPRDDAFCARSAGEWLGIAVADGVGSQRLSRYGACFAVDALCGEMLRRLTGSSPLGLTPLPRDEGDGYRRQATVPSTGMRHTRRSLRRLGRSLTRGAPRMGLGPAASEFHPPRVYTPADPASAAGTVTWLRQTVDEASSSAADGRDDVGEGQHNMPPPDHELATIMNEAFRYTRGALDRFAEGRSLTVRDIPCTLLGFVLNTKTSECAMGQIGDGLIGALTASEGALRLLHAPRPGEPGETYVVTQDDWADYLAVDLLPSAQARKVNTFFVMTDGVEEDCTHTPPPDVFDQFARGIDRYMREAHPPEQNATRLLHYLANYTKPGSGDDRTLAVVLRDDSEGGSRDDEGAPEPRPG